MSLALHRPWVVRLARWVAFLYRSELEHDDLVQAGMIGLHRLLPTFDAQGGGDLRKFALRRVLGAMFDEMRRTDPAWRVHHGGSAPPQFTGLDGAVDLHDQAHTPADLAELRDDCRAVRRLVRELPAREREVIVGIFDCGEPLKTVGRRLGVSDVYVCDIKRQALARLRIQFTALQRTMA